METIKDFFKEFKDRLTSPLIGSFILSWFLVNWQIPIVLIFYKQDQMKLESEKSFISFIKSQYTWQHCFLFPFLVALFYVFAYPYIRNWISEYVEKRKIVGEAALLKLSSNEGYVSISKHQLLQSQLNEKLSQLTKFYNEQTEIETKYIEQGAKVAELENNINSLRSQNDLLKNKTEANVLDKIYALEIIGKFQVKSFSDSNGINIMSLSNWEIIDYTTVNIHDDFRFDGSGQYPNIKPTSHRLFNLGITPNNELLMTMEDLSFPAHRYSIILKKITTIQYEGMINEAFKFTMTKIL